MLVFGTKEPGIIGDERASYTISTEYFQMHEYWFNPPLVFLVTLLVRMLGGASIFAFRLPHVIVGVATLLVMYYAGKLVGGRVVGMGACLVLLGSRLFVRYSFVNRHYSFFVFFSVLSIFLWYRNARAGVRDTRNELALFFSCLLGLLSHYFFVATVLGLILGGMSSSTRAYRRASLPVLLALLVVSPLLLSVAFHGVTFKLHEREVFASPHPQDSPVTTVFMVVSGVLPSLFSWGWLVVLPLSVLGAYSLWKRKETGLLVALGSIVLFSLLLVVASSLTIPWGWRYAMGVLAPVVILCGEGVRFIEARISESFGSKTRAGFVFLLLAALGLAMVSSSYYRLENASWGVYPQEVLDLVGEQGGVPIVVLDDYDMAHAIDYYLRVSGGEVSLESSRYSNESLSKYPFLMVIQTLGRRWVYFNPRHTSSTLIEGIVGKEYLFVESFSEGYDPHNQKIIDPSLGRETCSCTVAGERETVRLWHCSC